ncbi:PREDICTED: MATH and LRR domain-containing protein PFE0570w isoform X2 [Wasmannia auropunctata]|uniref:MATH and LRR domain-containing protein PFE0570w isoform X2 n=1 Tax=Wasmannia auropunctata TaxID=64793 RepID=UPI0005EE452A|nr:PREDICTED: MATH and LRR domain-containing protein PFE0570w isoform X2 [Wasmannia auropunctata]
MRSMRSRAVNKRNGRIGKFLVKGTNGTGRPDPSSLRKPIDTSVSDLQQVSRLLEDGTEEVKSILSYECNIIYECRICYSMYRSIVNLVSHKREYCKEKFDVTHREFHDYNYCARDSIIHMYKTQQTNDDGVKNDRILRSQASKEPNKKDLTTIIDMLSKRQEEDREKQLENENAVPNTPDDRRIYLEAIDTNRSAVYQTIKSDMVDNDIDLMKEEITELHAMMDQNDHLAPEGQMLESQVEKSDSPIQVNMSDEENELLIYRLPTNNLSCSICKARFSTKKTLTFHMKTQHTSKRLCFSCPYCTNLFVNTWGVYRHLFKAHKMTHRQVRQLRSRIQESAFHRRIAMKGVENVRATKVSVLKNVNSDKTQVPISIESNTKLRGRRGRKLRKKPLSAYLQCCQTPIAACDETAVRLKQCNNLSVSPTNNILCETEDVNLAARSEDKDVERLSSSSEICDYEMAIRVENVSSLNKTDWDILQSQDNNFSKQNSVNKNNSNITLSNNTDNGKALSAAENQDNSLPDENLKSSDITNKVSSTASKIKNKRKASGHGEKQLIDSKKRDEVQLEEDNSKLRSSCSASPNDRTSLMEGKLARIANFKKLRCLLCKRKFISISNLRRHAAMHVGWNRYRCELCDFKCFAKCECVAHCNKAHGTQNNNRVLAEMVLEIPPDEYTCNEDVTSPKEKLDNPDIAVTVSSAVCQETRADSNNSSDSNTHVSQSEAAAASERIAKSHGGVECSSDESRIQDMLQDMMNCKKLDDNPEFKQLAMEVIFGSDGNATERSNSDKSTLEASDDAGERMDANGSVSNTAITDKLLKKASRPILDSVKHRRPTRNRIRPLSEDFIYDLKNAHRKESAFTNDSILIRKKAQLYR